MFTWYNIYFEWVWLITVTVLLGCFLVFLDFVIILFICIVACRGLLFSCWFWLLWWLNSDLWLVMVVVWFWMLVSDALIWYIGCFVVLLCGKLGCLYFADARWLARFCELLLLLWVLWVIACDFGLVILLFVVAFIFVHLWFVFACGFGCYVWLFVV